MNFVAGIVVGVGISFASVLWTGYVYDKGIKKGQKESNFREPEEILKDIDIKRTDDFIKRHFVNQDAIIKRKPKEARQKPEESAKASPSYSYHGKLWFDRKKEIEKLFYEEKKGQQASGTELRRLAKRHGLLKGLKPSSEYSIVIHVMSILIKKGMARKVMSGRGKSPSIYAIYNLGNIVQ